MNNTSFHFLFKLDEKAHTCIGETFDSFDYVSASVEFKQKYPKAIFIGMYSLDTASDLLRHQIEFANKFKTTKSITDHEDHQEAQRLNKNQVNNNNMHSN